MGFDFQRRFDAFTQAAAELICLPIALCAGAARANLLLHDYERLEHLSDAQLAERRLRREDVARQVFGELLGPR